MNQLDAFDLPPIARNSDPDTSQQSAAITTRTNRGHDLRVMYHLIKNHPGRTCGELLQLLNDRGWKFHRVQTMSKRLYDLSTTGRIVSVDTRVCAETGRPARTWHVRPASF